MKTVDEALNLLERIAVAIERIADSNELYLEKEYPEIKDDGESEG